MGISDLIDRGALLAIFRRSRPWSRGSDRAYAIENVESAPTIDAEPVVHARWMQDDTLKDLYFCSKCLTRDHRKPKHKFCPDCGARMDADAPERGGEGG